MKLNVFLSGILVLLITPVYSAFAAEEITFDYTYEGNVRQDFSNIRGGPLGVGEISDSREVESPNVITDSLSGFVADKPLTEIVRNALVQGFEKGKATLADEGANKIIQGTILSSEAEIVDRDGVESLQITVRTNVELRDGSRTIWQTILFGRGIAPVTEGMEQALSAAMDRTIRSLLQDDYFLMEVI